MTATAPSPAPRPGEFISPAALMAIRSLELRARAVMEGFMTGLHRSPWHGFSAEFTEYRQYSPGDDPRHLDWKVFARSDRFFIRKFEDETNLRCHMAVDQSRSMDCGSLAWTKAHYAATLAATLGLFLHRQGDATGLLSFDERIRDWIPARHRPGHLRRIMLALEKPAGGAATDLTAPLQRLAEIVRKRGLMVLISDFLAPVERLEHCFSQLGACGHEITVFQVLDPAEATFDFTKEILFEDAETGRTLFIDPAAARRSYLEKLGAHEQGLRAVCAKLGIGFQRVLTNEPLEIALSGFLRERARRGRPVRRAAQHGTRT
ncbi:MAG TPA: DUF58 domain-containing protein [Verrucomicrobiales bacterium]|nr:DUF58 domain-containing protein [Verrucomicrobiales bacterium]